MVRKNGGARGVVGTRSSKRLNSNGTSCSSPSPTAATIDVVGPRKAAVTANPLPPPPPPDPLSLDNVNQFGVTFCLECKTKFNDSNNRPVQEGCGHVKCRSCLIRNEDGCKQCKRTEAYSNSSTLVVTRVPDTLHLPSTSSNAVAHQGTSSSTSSSSLRSNGFSASAPVWNSRVDSLNHKSPQKRKNLANANSAHDPKLSFAGSLEVAADYGSGAKRNRRGDPPPPPVETQYYATPIGASGSHCKVELGNEIAPASRNGITIHRVNLGADRQDRAPRPYTNCSESAIHYNNHDNSTSTNANLIPSWGTNLGAVINPKQIHLRNNSQISSSDSDGSQFGTICPAQLQQLQQLPDQRNVEPSGADNSNSTTDDAEDNSQKPTEGEGGEKKKKKRSPVFIHEHIKILSGDPQMYQCSICTKKFKTKAHIKYHEFCQNGEKPFRCEQCGQGFIAKSHYEYHLRTHTGERPYVCPKCGKGFNQMGKVTRHMRSHTGEKPFHCETCGRGFANAQAMRSHYLIHTGERPFACEHCNKRFTGMTNLKKHIITHTGERPFMCVHCGKSFGLKWTLDLHMRTHSSERPYACDQCTRAFSNSKDLRRHLVIHSGERPFKCWLCGTAFRRKDNLDRHIKNTHNQPKEVAKKLANQAAAEYLASTKAANANNAAASDGAIASSSAATSPIKINNAKNSAALRRLNSRKKTKHPRPPSRVPQGADGQDQPEITPPQKTPCARIEEEPKLPLGDSEICKLPNEESDTTQSFEWRDLFNVNGEKKDSVSVEIETKPEIQLDIKEEDANANPAKILEGQSVMMEQDTEKVQDEDAAEGDNDGNTNDNEMKHLVEVEPSSNETINQVQVNIKEEDAKYAEDEATEGQSVESVQENVMQEQKTEVVQDSEIQDAFDSGNEGEQVLEVDSLTNENINQVKQEQEIQLDIKEEDPKHAEQEIQETVTNEVEKVEDAAIKHDDDDDDLDCDKLVVDASSDEDEGINQEPVSKLISSLVEELTTNIAEDSKMEQNKKANINRVDSPSDELKNLAVEPEYGDILDIPPETLIGWGDSPDIKATDTEANSEDSAIMEEASIPNLDLVKMEKEESAMEASAPPSIEKEENAQEVSAPPSADKEENELEVSAPPPAENEETTMEISAQPSTENDESEPEVSASPPTENEESALEISAPPSIKNEESELEAYAPPPAEKMENAMEVSAPPATENGENALEVNSQPSTTREENALEVSAPPSTEDDESELEVSAPSPTEDEERTLEVSAPPSIKKEENELEVFAPTAAENGENALEVSAPPSPEKVESELEVSAPPSPDKEESELEVRAPAATENGENAMEANAQPSAEIEESALEVYAPPSTENEVNGQEEALHVVPRSHPRSPGMQKYTSSELGNVEAIFDDVANYTYYSDPWETPPPAATPGYCHIIDRSIFNSPAHDEGVLEPQLINSPFDDSLNILCAYSRSEVIPNRPGALRLMIYESLSYRQLTSGEREYVYAFITRAQEVTGDPNCSVVMHILTTSEVVDGHLVWDKQKRSLFTGRVAVPMYEEYELQLPYYMRQFSDGTQIITLLSQKPEHLEILYTLRDFHYMLRREYLRHNNAIHYIPTIAPPIFSENEEGYGQMKLVPLPNRSKNVMQGCSILIQIEHDEFGRTSPNAQLAIEPAPQMPSTSQGHTYGNRVNFYEPSTQGPCVQNFNPTSKEVEIAKAIATTGEMDRLARAREVEPQRYTQALTWDRNSTSVVDANCFEAHQRYEEPDPVDLAPPKRRRDDSTFNNF